MPLRCVERDAALSFRDQNVGESEGTMATSAPLSPEMTAQLVSQDILGLRDGERLSYSADMVHNTKVSRVAIEALCTRLSWREIDRVTGANHKKRWVCQVTKCWRHPTGRRPRQFRILLSGDSHLPFLADYLRSMVAGWVRHSNTYNFVFVYEGERVEPGSIDRTSSVDPCDFFHTRYIVVNRGYDSSVWRDSTDAELDAFEQTALEWRANIMQDN